jgi:hypothetical protein
MNEARCAGPPEHESSPKLHGEEVEAEGFIASDKNGWWRHGVDLVMKRGSGSRWCLSAVHLERGEARMGPKIGGRNRG